MGCVIVVHNSKKNFSRTQLRGSQLYIIIGQKVQVVKLTTLMTLTCMMIGGQDEGMGFCNEALQNNILGQVGPAEQTLLCAQNVSQLQRLANNQADHCMGHRPGSLATYTEALNSVSETC